MFAHMMDGMQSFPVMFMKQFIKGREGVATLEDAKGAKWEVEWAAWEQSGRRLALTRGWPEFAESHRAQIGDVLLIEILSRDHFKVRFINSKLRRAIRSRSHSKQVLLAALQISVVTSWKRKFYIYNLFDIDFEGGVLDLT